MVIKIQNVTHTYSPGTPWEFTALSNVDLTINEGMVLGLTGGVGSGKSTLASLIAGSETPVTGSITIDGSLPHPGKNVGILPQQPEEFFFEKTVFADIAFGLKNKGLTEHEINKRIYSTLDMIGLDHAVLDKSPFHLSRGIARLAALASVLAMRTKYLVLDEPTVNMDSKSKKKILGVIQSLSEKVTVIYISHQIHEVSAISDQMCVLGNGRVLFSGLIVKYKQWAFKENKEDLLPVIDQVMYGLKELGMDINTDVISLDDAVSNIQIALKRGK